MTDTVQPGTEIDAALWSRFREAVEQRTGGVRGHVRSELETAIRLYLSDETALSSVQVNQRLARIEGELGIAEADGGTDTVGADSHTHAPTWSPGDEKPSANAPTEEKVEYLAAQVGSKPEAIPEAKLRDIVKEEYGFRKDTAKRYVDQLIGHFDLVDHPDPQVDILVSRERREELVEQRREEIEAEADAELSEVPTHD